MSWAVHFCIHGLSSTFLPHYSAYEPKEKDGNKPSAGQFQHKASVHVKSTRNCDSPCTLTAELASHKYKSQVNWNMNIESGCACGYMTILYMIECLEVRFKHSW